MGKVDIWMPVYIGDYLRDTQNLTAEEHGVYLLLLMYYWQKRGEIGSDLKRLSIVARSTQETTECILTMFFELVDGKYRNKRSDKELEDAQSRSNAARENVLKRWAKDTPVLPPYYRGNTNDDTESIRNGYSSSSPSSKEKEEDRTAPKESKHKYGEDDNVLLRDSERDKLVAEYGQDAFDSIITELSSYKTMSGKKYASDYMAICRWVADKVIKSNPKPKPEYKEPEETPVSQEVQDAIDRQYAKFGM